VPEQLLNSPDVCLSLGLGMMSSTVTGA